MYTNASFGVSPTFPMAHLQKLRLEMKSFGSGLCKVTYRGGPDGLERNTVLRKCAKLLAGKAIQISRVLG